MPFTYPEVGATATDVTPPGYGSLRRTRTLKRTDFPGAVDDLMSWQVQVRSGFRVQASSDVAPGAEVVMRLGVGRLSLRIPCRVVYVIEEPGRRGFAYGSLPGHPETGEEAFLLEHRPDGRIDFTVAAFSRPASRLARLGGPASTLVQRLVTARYLRALDAPA